MPDNIENGDNANELESQNQNVNDEEITIDPNFDPRELPTPDAFDDNEKTDDQPNVDPEYQKYLRQKESTQRQERAKNDVAAAKLKIEKMFSDGDAPEDFRTLVMSQFDAEVAELVDKGRPQNEIFKRAKDLYTISRNIYIKSYQPTIAETEEKIKKEWGTPHSEGNAPRKQELTIADWMKLPEADRESKMGEVKKNTNKGQW
jgi:hypothetical protein